MRTGKGRGGTRDHIKRAALALFNEHGYERTSLREIADHLGITKAAIYYHFKAKEEIVAELCAQWIESIEDVVDWMQSQPSGLSCRQEALRRYASVLEQSAPLTRFLRENQAALRDLAVGAALDDVLARAWSLFEVPGAGLSDRLRCIAAISVVHRVPAAFGDADMEHAAVHDAALTVGLELLAAAHPTGYDARLAHGEGPASAQ
ncbi:TetR family transcriptional regulator [Streptomyces sp. NPDC048002]|uniref:TetR/AcrR family transcriptional regulator n=1 Tax=Streptomyces sp. NPDC048002 TaxID=3154344 RepID=UPI0033C6A67D